MDLQELLWEWQQIFLRTILNELVQATLLLLDNPNTSIEEIMKVMPGPDFPTGGIICGYRGIRRSLSHRTWKSHFARCHPRRRIRG